MEIIKQEITNCFSKSKYFYSIRNFILGIIIGLSVGLPLIKITINSLVSDISPLN